MTCIFVAWGVAACFSLSFLTGWPWWGVALAAVPVAVALTVASVWVYIAWADWQARRYIFGKGGEWWK